MLDVSETGGIIGACRKSPALMNTTRLIANFLDAQHAAASDDGWTIT